MTETVTPQVGAFLHTRIFRAGPPFAGSSQGDGAMTTIFLIF